MLMSLASTLAEGVPEITIDNGPSDWVTGASVANVVLVLISTALAAVVWISEVKRSSKRNVAEFITSVTTGPTAEARDHVGILARDGKIADHKLSPRHSIFEVLWALHRASALASDVDCVDDVYREILCHHVTQMTGSLGGLGKDIVAADDNGSGKPDYSHSVKVAAGGLKALAHEIGDPKQGEDWAADLSNLTPKEADSQSTKDATFSFAPCYAKGSGFFTKLCEKVRRN